MIYIEPTFVLPLKASEALIEVSGDILWMNNTAPLDGGALYLTSHAQIRLHPLANLTFVANGGRYVPHGFAEMCKTI